MSIIVRKATVEDIPSIHKMVVELAVFEKEPEAVKVDVAYYLKCFNEKIFDCIVAENDHVIIGIALFYMTFSTWKGKMLYLEDFVVKNEWRKKGVGQKLWDAYISEAKNLGCALVKWQVLDWNETAVNFYEKNGAMIEKEWWNGKIIF